MSEAVIIAGAGPVGFTLALKLASQDLPVIVLEQAEAVQDDLRASTFHPPTLEMLDSLGLAKPLIGQGLITPSWQIRVHETGEKAEFDLSVLADDTPYPFRLQAEQRLLCALAEQRARAFSNLDLRFGWEVLAVDQDADRVTVTVRNPAGEVQPLTTPFLLAADGGRSTVRSQLGLDFSGMTYPETTILATTRFPFQDHLPGLSNVNYVWCEQGTFSLLRLPAIWRCSLYADPEETVEDALMPAAIERKLQRIVPRSEPYAVEEIRPYRIHQRILENYRHGRILFAGDAAHLNSPSGGMGMNGGIHDAFNLAEKLPPVWRGTAALESLDRYTRQRQPIAKEQILQQAHRNRTRMQERSAQKRQQELQRLQVITSDRQRLREYLLNSSMISGLRKAALID